MTTTTVAQRDETVALSSRQFHHGRGRRHEMGDGDDWESALHAHELWLVLGGELG